MTLPLGLTIQIDENYLLFFETQLDDLFWEDETIDNILELTFEMVKDSLQARGYDLTLIPTDQSTKLKRVHSYKTMEHLHNRAIKESGDRHDVLSAKYKDLFLTTIDQIRLDVDIDESGVIEEDEENVRKGWTLSR